MSSFYKYHLWWEDMSHSKTYIRHLGRCMWESCLCQERTVSFTSLGTRLGTREDKQMTQQEDDRWNERSPSITPILVSLLVPYRAEYPSVSSHHCIPSLCLTLRVYYVPHDHEKGPTLKIMLESRHCAFPLLRCCTHKNCCSVLLLFFLVLRFYSCTLFHKMINDIETVIKDTKRER